MRPFTFLVVTSLSVITWRQYLSSWSAANEQAAALCWAFDAVSVTVEAAS